MSDASIANAYQTTGRRVLDVIAAASAPSAEEQRTRKPIAQIDAKIEAEANDTDRLELCRVNIANLDRLMGLGIYEPEKLPPNFDAVLCTELTGHWIKRRDEIKARTRMASIAQAAVEQIPNAVASTIIGFFVAAALVLASPLVGTAIKPFVIGG